MRTTCVYVYTYTLTKTCTTTYTHTNIHTCTHIPHTDANPFILPPNYPDVYNMITTSPYPCVATRKCDINVNVGNQGVYVSVCVRIRI